MGVFLRSCLIQEDTKRAVMLTVNGVLNSEDI